VGLLLVKNYIMLNPEAKTPVRELLKNECTVNLVYVLDDMPLFDLLNLFQEGKSKKLDLIYSWQIGLTPGNIF
jgi:hypothetical protein